MNFETIIKLIQAKENFKSGSPASDDDIGRIEKVCDVILSDSYKYFVKKFGYARWFGVSIYGVFNPLPGQKILMDYNAVAKTISAKNERLPDDFAPFPKQCLVIGKYAGGGYYVLRSMESERPGYVVLIDHDQMGIESQMWTSFEEFLGWISEE